MKSNRPWESWEFRWFGVFRRNTPFEAKRFPAVPPVTSFIDPMWSYPYRDRLLHYLSNAAIGAKVWRLVEAPCLVCGCSLDATIFRWDGIWFWPDSLSHYVATHDVRLPDEMVASIEARSFEPPVAVDPPPLDTLPWPPALWPASRTRSKLLQKIQEFFSFAAPV